VSRTSIVLFGATGRMGRAIRAALPEFPDTSLAACVAPAPDASCAPECPWLTPEDLVANPGRVPSDAVVIDVSLAAGTTRLLDALERAPRALLSATTGVGEADERRIRALGSRAAVLRARNLSVGNAVALAMMAAIPPAAGRRLEVDVVEHHHRGKRDAPSGTAMVWASVLAGGGEGMIRADAAATLPRDAGEIRIHSIRSGSVTGTHRAILALDGETLEIVHTVSDRSVFARGALLAARFLGAKPPGVYAFEQVLESP
jgi:4-hydroxy-tetrahydrodipicolinate reductase